MRVLRPSQEEMRLQRVPAHPLHEQDFGAAIGPHRPADRSPARRFRPDVIQSPGRTLSRHPPARHRREDAAGAPLQGRTRHPLQRPDDPVPAAQIRRTQRRRPRETARRHGTHEHERPRLRPHPQSRPHHRRPRSLRRRPRPPHHGSHRLPQPRPPHLPGHFLTEKIHGIDFVIRPLLCNFATS